MNTIISVTHGVLVEDEVQFSLVELSRACHADVAQLVALVDEGVLTPSGDHPQYWTFGGAALQRARLALRLARDLELGVASIALVLDLIDEIAALKARLQLLGSI